jgi:hypothetical protein
VDLNIIATSKEEIERMEDELCGKGGPLEHLADLKGVEGYNETTEDCGDKCTPDNCVCDEPPMTHDELIAVSAHMAFNISTLLKEVDNRLSDEALALSEKLLSRYEERKVGLQESEIEDLKKRILG